MNTPYHRSTLLLRALVGLVLELQNLVEGSEAAVEATKMAKEPA